MDLEKKYKELFELFKRGELAGYDAKDIKDTGFDFNYDKMIPYPEPTDQDFNKKIYWKQEFHRNKSSEERGDFDRLSANKCSHVTFSLSPNQKLIKNFFSPMTPYNSMMLYHSVGVGKTCSAISIAEQYHDIYQKKVLVILSSTLVDNFKKQIFDITKYNIRENEANLCTGTRYPDMVLDKHSLTPEALEKRVNSLIKERYKFMGYKELAIFMEKLRNIVNEQQRDPAKRELAYVEKVKEHFSDRLIIIDEAHNLRVPGETGKKLISEAFLELMKHVENVKLVLLTATPMFNEATEIVWTMNLLLTNDNRPTLKRADLFDKDGNITPQGKKRLIEASRGYVSYMRGENPFSFPFRIFPSMNNPKDPNILAKYPTKDIYGKKIEDKIKFLEIIQSNMSDYQKKVYDIFKKRFKAPEDDEDDEDEETNNDLKNTMQVSNIVYPYDTDDITTPENLKKTYGKGGFDNCFDRKGGKYEYRKDVKEKYGEFLSYNSIEEYAPKIKTILDYVISSKGIVFIYSRYYPAGLIPLAIALEHIGLAKHSPSGNIAGGIKIDNKFGAKRFKYIILSRRSELSPNNDLEIATTKSDDNKEGEIIKVVIVSKIGTEGIDFKRIREVHLLEPWFNLNRAEQVIGRAVRNCSHSMLPKEKRNVTIYFHANCYSEEEESADLQTYRVAEGKQKRIIAVESVLKENAFDCNLNKDVLLFRTNDLKIKIDIETSQGNVIKGYNVGDRDNSFICGFKKCESSCNPELQNTRGVIDKTTFEDEFILDDIEMCKRYIANLFKKETRLFVYNKLLDAVKEQYKAVDDDVFRFALDEMVEHQYPIYNNESRRYGYIIYRGKKYVFQYYSIKDTRLSIEERQNITKKQLRLRLDIDKIAKETKGPIKEEPVTNEDAIDNPVTKLYKDYYQGEDNLIDVLVDNHASGLSEKEVSDLKAHVAKAEDDDAVAESLKKYLNVHYKAVKPSLKPSNTLVQTIEREVKKYSQYVMDSVVDRMNGEQLVKLLNYLASDRKKGELEGMLKKSLSPWMIKDTHFFNPYDKTLYHLKPNRKYKLSGPTDRTKEIDDAYKVMKALYEKPKLESKTMGYMHRKKDQIVYKIRNNDKQNGAVCGTSQMIDDLLGYVKSLEPALFVNNRNKHKKALLCFMLELLQRKAGVFERNKI